MPARHLNHWSPLGIGTSHSLRALALSDALRQIGINLLTLSVPALFLQQADSWTWFAAWSVPSWQKALAGLFLLYALSRIIVMGTHLFLPWLIEKMGLTNLFIAGHLSFVFFALAAYGSFHNQWLLLLLPFFVACKMTTYWLPHHLLLSGHLPAKHTAQAVGSWELIIRIGEWVALLGSGLLIANQSGEIVFLIAMISFLLAMFAANNIPNLHIRAGIDWHQLGQTMFAKERWPLLVAIAANTWDALLVSSIWPLALLIFTKNGATSGYILAGAGLIAALMSYLAGSTFGSKKSHAWLGAAASLRALAWFPRALAAGLVPGLITLNETIDRMAGGYQQATIYINLIKDLRQSPLAHILSQTYMITLYFLLNFVVLILVIIFWPAAIWWLVSISGAMAVLLTTIVDKNGKKS